ncbi:glycoside hydrolase family 88/105 protein [Paenibacillus alkalitolerans]|uniref:glycoside hydrolase family 88/105 protein n=1 Tax=Paenibacillus alkalitolerans TaxID=2799335 RepID=UPI0018F37E04|nr:glycoside hydrolase family 88 protein [Paenibacillus alkalitolerans]
MERGIKTASYIREEESIDSRLRGDHRAIVSVLADRYIGANPPLPFVFRAWPLDGIMQTADGLFDINWRNRFPDAAHGMYAYACGAVWSDAERSIDLVIECYGPVQLFCNGSPLYRSNAIDEVKKHHRSVVEVTFRRGWNTLFVKARNTTAGFGCAIGADEAKVRILHVLSPFTERMGQAGWVFTAPTAADVFAGGERLPDAADAEPSDKCDWYPLLRRGSRESAVCSETLYGLQPGKKVYAWTRLERLQGGPLTLSGRSDGALRVWFGSHLVLDAPAGGEFLVSVPRSLVEGCDVYVESVCGNRGWSFELRAAVEGRRCMWEQPHPVHGYDGPWLLLGPIDETVDYGPAELGVIHHVYDGGQKQVYWRTAEPLVAVRPFYENAMLSNKWTTSGMTNFARWDYPLGVTMYGLLKSGRLLGRADMIEYVKKHIGSCTKYYDYSLWDKEQYGFPSVNHQLVLMKMLDNCGSFGSSMLEAYRDNADESYLPVAETIASFIRDRLERREDGAFYRICEGEYSENSMWADDLYMSTPFMKRYAQLKGDKSFLDDAARQFLLYKKYLFMPVKRIMSHVYDFKYGTATKVPWGRGNGWVLFSLSELLEAVPETHPHRSELLPFFNDLCEGYLALQGESGMWRQVLDDPEAYEESSCTAMFTYAFARGVYNGWLHDPDRFAAAAFRGWHGLTRHAIDRAGNVYGVCSGSRYSFTAEYYKDDLKTVTNDNHGIGIVMLAGTEICKLAEWMAVSERTTVESAK